MTQWLEAIVFKCRFETTDLRREAHLELDCSRLLSLASASVSHLGSTTETRRILDFRKIREIDSGYFVCNSLNFFFEY